MTYAPGDCFTLTPEAAKIYSANQETVYRVKFCGGTGMYVTDGVPCAVHEFEMFPHPGPPTPLPKPPRKRRGSGSHDLRTPAQLFQADIYQSIMARRINGLDAVVVLLDTAEAIEAGTDEIAVAETARKRLRRYNLDNKAFHNIDGNPLNNDPANLRVVDVDEIAEKAKRGKS